MTSTSSANATALPSRRALIAQAGMLASVGAAGAALAIPALAASADEHLFDLYRRLAPLRALAAEADRRERAVSAAFDRAMEGKAPDALFVRADDELNMSSRPEMRHGEPTGRRTYDTAAIDRVAAQLAALSDRAYQMRVSIDPRWATRLARLREIVDGQAAWQAARYAAYDAAGVSEAQDAAEEAHARCRKVISEIAWCPATTLDGVLLKARIALPCFGDTLDEAVAAIDDVLDEEADGEGLALSILKDLLRMAPKTAMGGTDA